MDLELVVTPGLGDNSYLVFSAGEAVVVDPQRDVQRLLAIAEQRRARIHSVLETHVHNDYVSGALEIRAATGAEIVAPARGRYAFPHVPASEGDERRVGSVRLVAMETPGHTPEHLAFLALDDQEPGGRPVAVFTGGSLMVGGAGRTDLLGPELTDHLTHAQFRTMRRLAELPDEVQVLPTHGAGSFCGTGPAPVNRTSTLGEERTSNPALTASDEASFVRQQVSGLREYPTYYAYMAPINRAGPRLVREVPKPRPLKPSEFSELMAAGTWSVDGRDRWSFARKHILGSINVELDESFASYVGWVVPFGAPIVLVLPEPLADSLDEARTQLLRIGYERVDGYLRGGVEEWEAAGHPVRSYPTSDIDELCGAFRSGSPPAVLDVRQQDEWDSGHIPGSTHLFVGDLPRRLDAVPSTGEVWAVCSGGHRSAIAASLLEGAGVPVGLVAEGGVDDWLARCR